MDYETYKRKVIEEDECERLRELQNKYNGMETPKYSDMSLRDELQIRFDMDELNDLQQKHGAQQILESEQHFTTPAYKTGYMMPNGSQQPVSRPSAWNNTLRKAEQLTTGALDGVSLGWADELEGAASAVGYGLASLNPSWNRTNESVWDAMKRGYVQGRDNRRQVLAEGLQENPTATTVAQMVGAFASPIKSFRYSKTAPLSVKDMLNKHEIFTNGLIYGIGSGQDSWQNYARQTLIGILGNRIGYRASRQALGRAASPLGRSIFNTLSGRGGESAVDNIQNQYHSYNK